MTHDQIRKTLVDVIENSAPGSFSGGTITDATPLEAFGVDSLVMIDLIFDLEQELGVKLEAEQLTTMKTVGDIVAHIEQRLAT